METDTNVRPRLRTETSTEPCPACHGEGLLFTRANDGKCDVCSGTGLGRSETRYFVNEQLVSAQEYSAAFNRLPVGGSRA